jgi:capsular exopolysaccharide synthesis family protein
MNQESTEFDLAAVLKVLRRRGAWILVCAVAAAGAAYGISKQQRKEYTANASILFQNQGIAQQTALLSGVANSTSQSQTDTNLKLVTLPRIAVSTAAAVGNGMTPGAIRNAVSVTQQSDTDLATVSATAKSPGLAATIANNYAQQAIQYRQETEKAYYADALRAVNLQLQALPPAQQGGTVGTDLRDRAAALQSLEALQTSDAQLAQPASPPTAPSSPKVTRNTALGLILGLLLGLALAIGLERFDRRIRDPKELEAAYGLPLVGVVPESDALNRQSIDGGMLEDLPSKESEIFGLLRAHVRYFNVDKSLKVLVVVSAAPGDGKSTVARDLAVSFARVGDSVLFVEADLRRPTAAEAFGISTRPGLAEIFIDEVPLAKAVQHVTFLHHGGQTFALDVLVAGGVLPPNPALITESDAMESLMRAASQSYDLVVVDTPPLSIVSDAFPLMCDADGVLVVSHLDKARKDSAERLRATLEKAEAPLVGIVANGYRQRRGTPYDYGYGYGYEYSSSAPRIRVSGSMAVTGNGRRSADEPAESSVGHDED